jgi:hypothetical protein
MGIETLVALDELEEPVVLPVLSRSPSVLLGCWSVARRVPKPVRLVSLRRPIVLDVRLMKVSFDDDDDDDDVTLNSRAGGG